MHVRSVPGSVAAGGGGFSHARCLVHGRGIPAVAPGGRRRQICARRGGGIPPVRCRRCSACIRWCFISSGTRCGIPAVVGWSGIPQAISRCRVSIHGWTSWRVCCCTSRLLAPSIAPLRPCCFLRWLFWHSPSSTRLSRFSSLTPLELNIAKGIVCLPVELCPTERVSVCAHSRIWCLVSHGIRVCARWRHAHLHETPLLIFTGVLHDRPAAPIGHRSVPAVLIG